MNLQLSYFHFRYSDSATTDSSSDLYESKLSRRGKTYAVWSHRMANRERLSSNARYVDTSYGQREVYRNEIDERRVSKSDCDIDKMYPDLCRPMAMQTSVISSSSPRTQLRAHQQQSNRTISTSTSTSNNNKSTSTAPSNPFYTFPRKKRVSHRRISESQSPLLNDSMSQIGSSTLSDIDSCNRCVSNESFENYPLSICTRNYQSSSTSSNEQRSNGFLHATTKSSSRGAMAQNSSNSSSHLKAKRNPSLPTSLTKGPSSKLMVSGVDETPLLDFSSFAMPKQQMITTNLSTALDVEAAAGSIAGGDGNEANADSAAATNAYDYHAAQLDRFLEEYRNLQEQLCKMKETCESIRKKEAPLRGTAGNSEFVQVADPIMFNALNKPNVSGPLPFEAPSNSKGLLKNKILLPNQPPDPPPYWLHRNAMLKRLQNPNPDYYHS